MRIARFLSGDVPAIGVVQGDQLRRIRSARVNDGMDLARLGVVAIAGVPGIEEHLDEARPLESVTLLAPVPHPSKIICIGANFREHAAESEIPEPIFPEVFAKFPNTISGPGSPIVMSEEDEALDYEGELCVVIGRQVRDLSEATALTAVAGYMIANDVTARTWQLRVSQWVLGKSFDSYCPTGPWLVTPDEIPDPQALDIRTTVNGVTVQSDSTARMVFGVQQLLIILSSVMTLEPGDLLLTGTPAGIGHARKPKRYLKHDDTVTIEISAIGALTNVVIGSSGAVR